MTIREQIEIDVKESLISNYDIYFNLEESVINNNTIIDFDCMGFVFVILELEEIYEININNVLLKKVKTVKNFIDLIYNLIT